VHVVTVPGIGWFPKISPTGRYVLSGAGKVQVFDRQTGRVTPLGEGWLGGWLNAATAVWKTSTQPVKAIAPDFRVVPAPEFAAGFVTNDFALSNGHWVATQSANWVVYDGTRVLTGKYWLAVIDNTTAVVIDGRNLVFLRNGTLWKTVTPLGNVNTIRISNGGYVGYGYFGRSWMVLPDGTQVETTVTPWKAETPAVVAVVGGKPWLASYGEAPGANNRGSCYVRPLGDDTVITVPFAAVAPDLKCIDGEFTLAGNDAVNGILRVATFSPNESRVRLTTPGPAPTPRPPSPPQETDVTEEQVKKIVADALKPLEARLTALEHAAAPVPQPNPPAPQPNLTPELASTPEPSLSGDLPEAVVVLADARDIREWPVTSEVTEAFIDRNKGVVIKHTKAGKWPVLTDEGGGGEGNPWVIANVDGQWYTATYEWLRPGQTAKLGGKIETIGAHTKKDPLDTWVPATGERIGLFVSTFARDRRRSFPERAIKGERSNVAWVKWP
jgi:hypothetical protein